MQLLYKPTLQTVIIADDLVLRCCALLHFFCCLILLALTFLRLAHNVNRLALRLNDLLIMIRLEVSSLLFQLSLFLEVTFLAIY